MKRIAILGSTGSIGTSVLEVVRQYPGRFRVCGLAAGGNIGLLERQIEAFEPEIVSVADEQAAKKLADGMSGRRVKIVAGPEGAEQVAAMNGVDAISFTAGAWSGSSRRASL